MSNIFTTENISKYNTRGSTSGVGEYVLRNGYWAMNIRPAPFYQNYGTGDSRLLQDEFVPNTQYIFDLWIDTDDVIYNGNNVPAGLTLVYTDGTKNNSSMVFTGGSKGFQHANFVSDPTKSVKKLEVYYYTNTQAYYRADSYIAPLSNANSITKSGIIKSDIINETINTSTEVKFGKGYLLSNNIIEI